MDTDDRFTGDDTSITGTPHRKFDLETARALVRKEVPRRDRFSLGVAAGTEDTEHPNVTVSWTPGTNGHTGRA